MIDRTALGSRLVGRVRELGDRVWVGIVLAVLALLSLLRDAGADGGRPFGVGSAVILAVGVIALLGFGRRAPGAVALGIIGLTVLWYSLDHASSLINVLTLFAFYNLGLVADRRRALAVGVATMVVVVTAMVVVGDEDAADAASAVGWVLSALLLGALLQSRRLLLDAYRRRAEQAEATREVDAERRAQQVRVDIARDLHDLLAHTVSVMMVQAGVAAEAVDDDPVAAHRALAEIRRAGRDAMVEVGTVVEVLRDRGASSAVPLPGVERLTELAASLWGAGPDVELDLQLDGIEVPEAAGLTVYRVVQESLTNVVRHSAAASVTVRVVGDPAGGVVVEVRDPGPGRDDPVGADGAVGAVGTVGGGFGVIGMRERVESLGGRLDVGPDADGGWRVRARLPLHDAELVR